MTLRSRSVLYPGLVCALLFLNFRTPALASDPIVIGTIGDFGVGFDHDPVANLVKSWNPDIIITLGDNNYQNGSAALIDFNIGQFYHDYIYPYTGTYGAGASSNRFFPCLGNHDYLTTNAQPYIDYFTLPGNERYYTFQYGPVEFFVVDSNPEQSDGSTNGSVQALWLQAQLAASTNAWKIVYFHHPPFTSGIYNPGHPQLRWPFADWGASAVLTGHDHIYERLHIDNMLYLVNGLGGANPYPLGTPIPGSRVRYNARRGAMRIDATDTNLAFSFFNATNLLIDTITISNPFGVPGFLTTPQSQTSLLGRTVTLDSFATGSSLRYQWFLNATAIPDATNRTLTVTNLTFEQEGLYSISASNQHGTATESANLIVARHPLIVQHPTNTTALSGSTVTFRVQADATGPLHYQWRYNDSEITGATNSTYSITDVQRSHEGLYSVAATDDLGTFVSSNATLRVLVAPFFIVRPLDQTVIVGQTAVLSYVIGGDFPISAAVRHGSQPWETNVLYESQLSFITMTNVQESQFGAIAGFILTNDAARVTYIARITTVRDSDGDGAPDPWEEANGFDFANPEDGALDADNDGALNREEYAAGTNPNAADDALRLQVSLLSANQAALQFNAATNKTYALQASSDLLPPWNIIAEFGGATNARVLQITNTIEPTNRFYRVVTPRLP